MSTTDKRKKKQNNDFEQWSAFKQTRETFTTWKLIILKKLSYLQLWQEGLKQQHSKCNDEQDKFISVT